MSIRSLWLLRLLDQIFPPLPQGHKMPEEQVAYECEKAGIHVNEYLAELATSDIDVLDFGCGWGGETLWLARHVRTATGFDVNLSSIETAMDHLQTSGLTNCRFLHSHDGQIPAKDETFDAVVSTDVLEHVMNLSDVFADIFRVLKPGGHFLSSFGPLFYSPRGYHMPWACRVPWAHLIFDIKTILALRNERRRFGDESHALNWHQTGLNGKRFCDYRNNAIKAGFDVIRFCPIAVSGLRPLTIIPFFKDLLFTSIDCHLRKPQ